jgi:hypothetical protein
MIIAMIGTRQFDFQPEAMQHEFLRITRFTGEMGDTCRSGAAIGTDQIALMDCFRYGSPIDIVLPWATYEREFVQSMQRSATTEKPVSVTVFQRTVHTDWNKSVLTWHPAGRRLTYGAFALHARNYGITQPAHAVCALPSPEGGGTAQGMRIAQALGIPLFDFRQQYAADEYIEWRTAQ